jgi:hypothetical protein
VLSEGFDWVWLISVQSSKGSSAASMLPVIGDQYAPKTGSGLWMSRARL